jgi:hypothetical protein
MIPTWASAQEEASVMKGAREGGREGGRERGKEGEKARLG